MKKDNRNNIRRERFIMMTSSALVLTALTVSGVYMRNHSQRSLDNGYTIDFSALEDRADDKLKEIAKSSNRDRTEALVKEDEELFDPNLEAGSGEVKIPGLTDGQKSGTVVDQSTSKGMSEGTGSVGRTEQSKTESGAAGKGGQTKSEASVTGKSGQTKTDNGAAGKTNQSSAERGSVEKNGQSATAAPAEQTEQIAKADEFEQESNGLVAENSDPESGEELPIVATAAQNPIILDELHFAADTMVKPVSGEPIIEYSMDHSVYFATLDQYKYNPAVIYSAVQGEAAVACTTGRVINVHNDAELGHVLVMDLGDGYQATYGQLENIEVPIGSTVSAGTKLGTVAAPTKYYSAEGSNLYFKLTRDGESIDPGNYFK